MLSVNTRTWSDVISFYESLIHKAGWQIEPMLALVQFIASSPYADCLFPYTSHDVLGMGRLANFVRGDSELRIHYNPKTETFTFMYIQRPDDQSSWSRLCSASEWRSTLDRILQTHLGWFHENSSAR
jgi:hypothetical protein